MLCNRLNGIYKEWYVNLQFKISIILSRIVKRSYILVHVNYFSRTTYIFVAVPWELTHFVQFLLILNVNCNCVKCDQCLTNYEQQTMRVYSNGIYLQMPIHIYVYSYKKISTFNKDEILQAVTLGHKKNNRDIKKNILIKMFFFVRNQIFQEGFKMLLHILNSWINRLDTNQSPQFK